MRHTLLAILALTLATTALAQVPGASGNPAAKAWLDRALADLEHVALREDKAQLQAHAAAAAAGLGDNALAQQLQQAALANVTFTDDYTIGVTMAALAVSHARAGRIDAAIGAAKLAGSPADIAAAAADAAAVRAKHGDRPGFDRLIALAQEQRTAIDNPFDQAYANNVVADALAEAGDFSAATALAASTADAASRAESLANLAARAAAAGRADDARKLLADARAAIAAHVAQAKADGEEPYLDFINGAIVDALSALGQRNQAIALIPTIGDPSARAWAWIDVAQDAAADGDRPVAVACYDKAAAAILEMPQAYDRAVDLLHLAESRGGAGFLDKGFSDWIAARPAPVERAFAALGIADALIEAK